MGGGGRRDERRRRTEESVRKRGVGIRGWRKKKWDVV